MHWTSLTEADAENSKRRAKAVEAAVRSAVRDALIDHKRSGDPIVVYQDGKIVWVPAAEIEIPDEPEPI